MNKNICPDCGSELRFRNIIYRCIPKLFCPNCLWCEFLDRSDLERISNNDFLPSETSEEILSDCGGEV